MSWSRYWDVIRWKVEKKEENNFNSFQFWYAGCKHPNDYKSVQWKYGCNGKIGKNSGFWNFLVQYSLFMEKYCFSCDGRVVFRSFCIILKDIRQTIVHVHALTFVGHHYSRHIAISFTIGNEVSWYGTQKKGRRNKQKNKNLSISWKTNSEETLIRNEKRRKPSIEGYFV